MLGFVAMTVSTQWIVNREYLNVSRVVADVDGEGQLKGALLFRPMDSGEASWWQGSEARRTPQNPASPLVGKLHTSFLFETCLFVHSSHLDIYNLFAAMIK